jgi:hypothetical protein
MMRRDEATGRFAILSGRDGIQARRVRLPEVKATPARRA